MAKYKQEDVVSLLKKKQQEVINDGQSWMDFIRSSSYTNKYPFNDQLLIYATNPDARACATMDFWNKKFGRWINRGAKGIPLLDIGNDGETRIKYVFDIADTHATKYTKRDVDLWAFNIDRHKEAFEKVAGSSGVEEPKYNNISDLQERIMGLAEKTVEYYENDILYDITHVKENSLIEELDTLNVEFRAKNILVNSLGFQLMERLDANPYDYFTKDDFLQIYEFNNTKLISTIGTSVSMMSKEVIRDLEREIKREEKSIKNDLQTNRESSYSMREASNTLETADKSLETDILNGGNKDENGRISRQAIQDGKRDVYADSETVDIRGSRRNLSSGGRDSSPKSNSQGTTRDDNRSLWQSKETILAGTQASEVVGINDRRNIGETSSRSSAESRENVGYGNTKIERSLERDGRIESDKSDEMGGHDEQYQANNRGNDLSANSIRIENQLSRFPDEKEQLNIIKQTAEKTAVFSILEENKFKVGQVVTINDNEYSIERLTDTKVSLRDLSFENNVGFPILRSERIEDFKELIKANVETIVDEKIAVGVGNTFNIFNNSQLEGININDIGTTVEVDGEEYSLFKGTTFEESQKVDVLLDTYGELDIKDHEVTSVQNEQKLEIEKIDFTIMDNELGVGTNSEKLSANIEAIKTLQLIESEDRLAITTEQEILSKYVGWGGLADVFKKDTDKVWAKSGYNQLKQLLTNDEFSSARESTLNAHYTSPIIVNAMYDALDKFGFKKGNILEPSCGVGNFIGAKPESMKDSKVYGVELDDISGRIAKQLYQNANITIDGFENALLQDNFFDVAIGNVPFGDYKVYDKRYDKEKFLIHDYFFGKSLDKVRPGGVVAFITSKGTMDKEGEKVRKYLSQRAELVGAIRLPNNAFKANAGTEVTSDIIFLKKRDRLVEIDEPWVHLSEDDNGIRQNSYFVDNPEMVLGSMEMESTRYGMASVCKPLEDANLEEQLAIAVKNLEATISEVTLEDDVMTDETLPADPSVRNFSFTLNDEDIYFRENSVMVLEQPKDADVDRIKSMINLRDITRDLIRFQTEEFSDEDIKSCQNDLNIAYDEFVKKYGIINDKKNSKVFSKDSSYALLCSLEKVDAERGTAEKAAMFTERTIKKRIVPEHVDKPIDALALSISEKAKVDMSYMMELTNLSETEIISDLQNIIFENPLYSETSTNEEQYLSADDYLSGNVREKLEVAKNVARGNERFNANVEALEQVIPKDLEATEIDVRLGATWIPPKDVEKFMFEIFETPAYARWDIDVRFSSYTANWNIEGKSIDRGNIKANMTYGTERISGYKILEDSLNLKDSRVFDRIEDPDGKVRSVVNKKETMLAGQKQDALKEAFKDWMWKDTERRNRLVKVYNERFNAIRPREFDGSHINFDGMNPYIELREHQKNAVAHTLYGGNTLLGHVVGAGKSFVMIASAMESKRLGLCNKSMITVPNHLTEQLGAETLKLYPSANILVATKKDFEPKNRKKFCGRIATGDYDVVIIGHSQFERIPLSPERQRQEVENQIDEITNGIADIKRNHGDNFSIKQLEKMKKSLSARLQKLNDQSRKDDVVTFEELGIDKLIVDEAHSFKNLFLHTKMRNVAGIGQTEAKKSSDMFMKCRYMDEITGGKGIVFATGTPISNTMTELYTMQRYLQYGALKKQGLEHFDAWASTFGETTTAIELSPEGTGYRPKTRFSKFYNLPELMNMFREVADIKTSDMLNLPVPEAEYETVIISPSEHQKEMVKSLSERAELVRGKVVDPSRDNMLKITNDGRKLALDQRLMNPLLPREENGKVHTCANNVFDIWDKTKENKSAQMVFCDLSTPKNNGEFNVYDEIKDSLVSKGVPEKEIEFIHNAKTEKQKDALFAKVRTGDVRVLIGSTQKMGSGTNCQDKLIALHDLDCPWKPSDLTQRSGRIIRQGNENKKVNIFRYVTENTFDSYSWQLVENKQRFISQIMTSKSPVRSAEDVDESTLSYAEIKALATGNPMIKEKMDLDVQLSKLKMLHANYLSNKFSLEDKIVKHYPMEIKRLVNVISNYQKDMITLNDNTQTGITGEKKFNDMTIDGKVYGTLQKEEAGNALLEACKGIKGSGGKVIGNYRGFDMKLSYDTFFNEFNVALMGEINHSISLGKDVYGNITRIDNVLDSMNTKLEMVTEKLANVKVQLENAKKEVVKPFKHETELKEKTARLSELDNLLSMEDNFEAKEQDTEKAEIEIAKDLIEEFVSKEYDSTADFEDLSHIDIAYTTTEDDVYEIQIVANLEDYKIETYIEDILVAESSYHTLNELIQYELNHLSFDDLVYVDEADMEKVIDQLDKDKDNDGVIDRYDADEKDSNVSTFGELDERENKKSDRPSLLGQLKKNKEIISRDDTVTQSNEKLECKAL